MNSRVLSSGITAAAFRPILGELCGRHGKHVHLGPGQSTRRAMAAWLWRSLTRTSLYQPHCVIRAIAHRVVAVTLVDLHLAITLDRSARPVEVAAKLFKLGS